MFKSAVIQLTMWYLIIVMSLSLFFSVLLYWRLTSDLDRGLGRQAVIFQESPFDSFQRPRDRFEDVRQQQLKEVREQLLNMLTLVNGFVLLVAGIGSYVFARRTLRPIEDAHETQGRFTADASHELRTPLTAMKTEIEVALRDKNLSVKEAVELLQSNLEEVDKLQALSEGLLHLANYQSSKQTFSTVALSGLIEQSISRMAKALEQKNLELKVGKTSALIEGDEFALIEALTILLDNAIKYSPANGTITIGVTKSATRVSLSVKDEGPGIKQTDLPHIFDRFYRGDSSRSKLKVAGYGLGLSIALKIIQTHHGTIKVSSQVGQGATFTITLPIHQVALTIRRS